MEENKHNSVMITLAITVVVAGLLICVGGTAGLFYAMSVLNKPEEAPPEQVEESNPLLEAAERRATSQSREQKRPTFTPAPTATATPTPSPTEVDPAEILPEDAPIEPENVYLRFTVQVERLWLYTGPGNSYSPTAIAKRGDVLLAAGRTSNGLWWLVCCVDGLTGWMKLDGANVIADGDPGAVEILEGETMPEDDTSSTFGQRSLVAGRHLDERLERLGVRIKPVPVESGKAYWRVVELLQQETTPATGRQAIYVDVLDEQGKRLLGQPLTVSWSAGSQRLLMEDGPFPGYGAAFRVYDAAETYSLTVNGLPSEHIEGIRLSDSISSDDAPIEYLVTFQRTSR